MEPFTPPSLPPPPLPRTAPGISALALIGGAMIVAGAFMPWKSLGMISRSGVDAGGDGVVTALLGLLAVLAATAPLRGWRSVVCLLCGTVAALVGVVDIIAVQRQIDELAGGPFGGAMQVGYGLYATVAGGVLTAIGVATAKR